MRRPLQILCSVSIIALASISRPGLALAQASDGAVERCPAIADSAERDRCLHDAATANPVQQSGDTAILPPASAAARSDDQAIVVTGSRIRRSEFNSPDPIQVINPEIGFQQGQIQTVELVNSSPLATGSVQITSVISNNFVTEGGAGAQTVSLRGLGADRTLVLLNGRRAGPAGVRGQISSFDLNVLPASIIQSVDILKTGASSIYGSDAVAGVVNIITRRNTDGIEVRGFGSLPFQSGGGQYDLSATFGRTFDRGSFLISGDYFRQLELRRNDRDYLFCQEEYLTFTDPRRGDRADIVDPRTGRPACGGPALDNGAITSNDFTGPGFSQGLLGPNGQQLFYSQYAVGTELNGVCVPINGIRPGVRAPANFFGCNFDGPSTGALNQFSQLEQNSDVIAGIERYTIYAQGNYDLTPHIQAYAEFLYNKRRTHQRGFQQLALFQFTGNSALPAFFCDNTVFNCRDTDAGDPQNSAFAGDFLLEPIAQARSDFDTDIDYFRGVLGLRGDFGSFLSGWHWDVYGQYSRSEGAYTQDVIYQDSLFTQELRTRSCVGLTTPVRGVPCIDINFMDPRFLRGEFTDQERAFLFGRETGHTTYQQMTGEGTVTGNLFRLPAGEVGMALGVQFRRDEIIDTPGAVTLAGNAARRTSSGITAGHTLSKEIFGEIEIPLLHDTFLTRSFTVTGAARYTSVDATRGDGASDHFSDSTWKVGANWQVNDWLRFRGSWGTSYRAPALFELFLENQTGFQGEQTIDVCINTARNLQLGAINQRIFDNCAAAGIPSNFIGSTGNALVTSGGGLGNLQAETSRARVASVILTPDTRSILWGGMQISLVLDYFDIRVKGEITTLGASNIVRGCYNSLSYPTDPLCGLITRATAGSTTPFDVTGIRDTYVNINSQENRGIDATVRIVQDLKSWGTLSLLGQMTWQLHDTQALFSGTQVNLNGTGGDPKWTGNFQLTWHRGPWAALYGLSVIGGTSDLANLILAQGAACRTSLFRPGVPAAEAAAGGRVQFCPDVRLSPTYYHSLSITRTFGDRMAITLGVANVFDTHPPRASTTFVDVNLRPVGQTPVFGSQYDLVGRRVFANARVSF